MIVKTFAVAALFVTAICGLALSPTFVSAQRIRELRTVSPIAVAVELPKLELEREHSPPVPRADSGEKSAFAAGMLSFLVPGTGSFYAGNAAHGWTHMLIEVGTFGVGLQVAHTCNGDLGCGYGVLAGVGVVLIGNQLWSIVTAVSDAHATNRIANAVGKDASATPADRAHEH